MDKELENNWREDAQDFSSNLQTNRYTCFYKFHLLSELN